MNTVLWVSFKPYTIERSRPAVSMGFACTNGALHMIGLATYSPEHELVQEAVAMMGITER